MSVLGIERICAKCWGVRVPHTEASVGQRDWKQRCRVLGATWRPDGAHIQALIGQGQVWASAPREMGDPGSCYRKGGRGGGYTYERGSAGAVITKCHGTHLCSHGSGSCRCEFRLLRGLASPEASFLGSQKAIFSLCSHIVFPPCVSASSSPLLIGTPGVLAKSPPS